jgi:hypothetical protein
LVVPEIPGKLPDFVTWPSFPFEGDLRVKPLEPIADVEPRRDGEDIADCPACAAPDNAYIWVSERWRVRSMDRPSGLPMVLILESRSHLDLGDLPNLLAAELGVMTVRLERAIRSLDGVARVHVNRWGDGSAHLHLWFLARPAGRLQLRGPFLSLWNDILPAASEEQWRENLALIAAWLAEFGGRPLAEPPRIQWQAPSKFPTSVASGSDESPAGEADAASGGASPIQDEAGPNSGPTAAEPSSGGGTAAGPDADASGTTGALADAAAEPAVATSTDMTPSDAARSDAARSDAMSSDSAPSDAASGDAASGDAASGATRPVPPTPSTAQAEPRSPGASTAGPDRPADHTAVPAPRTSPESAGTRAAAS